MEIFPLLLYLNFKEKIDNYLSISAKKKELCSLSIAIKYHREALPKKRAKTIFFLLIGAKIKVYTNAYWKILITRAI